MRPKIAYATFNCMFNLRIFGRRPLFSKSDRRYPVAQPNPTLEPMDSKSSLRKPEDSGSSRGSGPSSRSADGTTFVDNGVVRPNKKLVADPSKPRVEKKDEEKNRHRLSLSLKSYTQTASAAEKIEAINKKAELAKSKPKRKSESPHPSPPRAARKMYGGDSSPSPIRLEDGQAMEDNSFLDFSQSNKKPEDYDDKLQPVHKKPALHKATAQLMGYDTSKEGEREESLSYPAGIKELAARLAKTSGGGKLPPCPIPQMVGQTPDPYMAMFMMDNMNRQFSEFKASQNEVLLNLFKNQMAGAPPSSFVPDAVKKDESEEEEEDLDETSSASAWSGSNVDFKSESVNLSPASIEFWMAIIGIDPKGIKELLFKKNWTKPQKLEFFLGVILFCLFCFFWLKNIFNFSRIRGSNLLRSTRSSRSTPSGMQSRTRTSA